MYRRVSLPLGIHLQVNLTASFALAMFLSTLSPRLFARRRIPNSRGMQLFRRNSRRRWRKTVPNSKRPRMTGRASLPEPTRSLIARLQQPA